MKLPEDRRSIVSFSGFNLKASTDPNAAHNVKLFLLKNDGATNTTIDVSQHLSMASPYEAMANLGKNGLQLDHLSERIELRSTTGGIFLSQIDVVLDKPREVIHLDCGDLTSAADNDALTMCPENAAVVGLAGGRGHGFDANEGHRFRCCKLGPVKITETCKELSTGVDSDTLTRPDEKGYVVTTPSNTV